MGVYVLSEIWRSTLAHCIGIASGSSQVVTHFSVGKQAALKSGDWVMTGGASLRNKIMAGAKSAWNESITTTVPKSSLSWPKGGEAWKGLIGQRIYAP
jgi:hypothetical protein